MSLTTNLGLALLPVVLFLAGLVVMDTFKLVSPRSILVALAAGAAAALACLPINGALLAPGADLSLVSRYVAPVVEEGTKGVFVATLLLRGRVGFLVDAAVAGFAVGAGFALVENVEFARARPDAGLTVFAVRGLGTAMLHGTTTAVLAMLAKTAVDRRERFRALALAPGFVAAVAIHSAFNHVLLPPVATAALLLAVLPPTLILVFTRSERATREWVGAGLDLDIELLELVSSEHFRGTRFGRYLQELTARVDSLVVADMFCLLRVELELAIQARALLLAREAGLEVRPDEDIESALDELEYLRTSIGRIGLLALQPLRVTSGRDRWHRHLLAEARGRSR